MKILHLLYSNGFSGAENVICQIIDMFRDDKSISMVYCSPDGPIRETLSERRIQFAPMKKLSVSEVRRIIKKEKPDLIHAHDMRAGFVAACACGSIPFVSHIHNSAFDSRSISVKSLAYRFAAKKAKHIFWVSESSYKEYRFHAQFKDKSSVLYNVINRDRLYEKMNADKQSYDYDIVYLGRLTPPKDPKRLIYVLRIVADKKQNVKIAIVGTGELEKETRQLSTELNLDNNIAFLGFQNNPFKILHDAKVMVMTSQQEGTPMCALEAMALGVPIVCTPVDGLKYIVEQGVNGFLCNDNNMLANQIIDIISNPEYHKMLSDNALIRAEIINNIYNYKKQLMKIYNYSVKNI